MKLNQFIAGCFGVVAFVVSIVAGLNADNPFNTILVRAMLAALGCAVVGYVVGAMANYIVQEHAQRLAAKAASAEAELQANKEKQPAAPAKNTAAPAGAPAV